MQVNPAMNLDFFYMMKECVCLCVCVYVIKWFTALSYENLKTDHRWRKRSLKISKLTILH